MTAARIRSVCVVLVLRTCLSVIRRLLRSLGYRRTCRVLLRTSPQPHLQELTPYAYRLLQAVGRRHPVTGRTYGSCLELGLLRWWLLRWWRISSDLQTGIRKNPDGSYYAHAWLVIDGHVVGEDGGSVAGYVPLWKELSTHES